MAVVFSCNAWELECVEKLTSRPPTYISGVSQNESDQLVMKNKSVLLSGESEELLTEQISDKEAEFVFNGRILILRFCNFK